MSRCWRLMAGVWLAVLTAATAETLKTPVPARPAGQTDVIELRCAPLAKVRIAIIGLGMRGSGAVDRLTQIPETEIKVICDVVPASVTNAQNKLKSRGRPVADTYTGADDWKKICERTDLDLIYVCTHWDLHTPIAVYAMEHGKHAAVEVPAALTLQECWQLVETAEKTRLHCMMLENCNYDFFELATLNMAQQGLFGDIMHCEGAYIHDLRQLMFTGYWNRWRLKHNELYDGNLYPTHGLGPICHVMNIHRGDRLDTLVSMSSAQVGMTEYATGKFGATSDYGKRTYRHGDMNTTLIKTARGKTMMIQHDVTNPRPYSRIHLISGTRGFAQKYPVETLAFEPRGHEAMGSAEQKAFLAKYAHPIAKEIGEKAKKVGGHGGMDFIMDYRLIYCLNKGLPLDQDVYDGAEWSSLVELTRLSVENNSSPVAVPDFTRGAWQKVQKVTYYHEAAGN